MQAHAAVDFRMEAATVAGRGEEGGNSNRLNAKTSPVSYDVVALRNAGERSAVHSTQGSKLDRRGVGSARHHTMCDPRSQVRKRMFSWPGGVQYGSADVPKRAWA